MIKFGPAGLGGVKDAISNLEVYNKLGLKACEIAFTYGVYIKRKEDALKIKKAAERFGIELSVHAPYWINLNSEDREKIEKSMKRILNCCEKADWLGAKKVVFHPGYYGKDTKEKTFFEIRERMKNMQETIKANKWNVTICPETTGKRNVFGSIEEISNLVEQTRCGFCIDFAHILARYGTYNFSLIREKFPYKEWHCHFSGIEYGEKGEKKHKRTPEKEMRKLLENLPKNKKITIINESPSPVQDSVLGISLNKK